MPLGARSGWKENRVARHQMTSSAGAILDADGSCNQIHGFVTAVEPVEFPGSAIPQPSGRVAISAAGHQLVARDRAAFDYPLGVDRRRIQVHFSRAKINRAVVHSYSPQRTNRSQPVLSGRVRREYVGISM